MRVNAGLWCDTPITRASRQRRAVGVDSAASAALSGRALLDITYPYGFGPCLDGDGARIALRLLEQGSIVLQHDCHTRMVWPQSLLTCRHGTDIEGLSLVILRLGNIEQCVDKKCSATRQG